MFSLSKNRAPLCSDGKLRGVVVCCALGGAIIEQIKTIINKKLCTECRTIVSATILRNIITHTTLLCYPGLCVATLWHVFYVLLCRHKERDCCPRNWDKFENHCYNISPSEKTWKESKEDCELQRANLVIITSQEEQVGSSPLWN